jgi:hypothetical protein
LIGPPHADGEYVGLRGAGPGTQEEIVHLHDYTRLYEVPGLYEHVVQELLGCSSPRVAADGLARAMERLALDPATVTVLDLGAGTGLVGELVRALGVETLVGVDSLAAARAACVRDRPGIYRDYLIGDLAHPPPKLLARLHGHHPAALVSAGAFGGTHAPADALINALALLPTGSPVVFTIDERWTAADGPGGFRTPVTRLLASDRLRLLERSRFQHRISTAGSPIHYELLVAVTGPAPPSLDSSSGADRSA